MAQMPTPPLPPQPKLLCSWAHEAVRIGIEEEKLEVPSLARERRWVGRIGRGGRLIFDRCRPFTWEPLDSEDNESEIKPMHELTNPYAQWSSKNDLAQAAMARMDGTGPPSTVVKLRITGTAATPAAAPPSGGDAAPAHEANNGATPATLGKRTSMRQRGT